jgi:hypothetical protein
MTQETENVPTITLLNGNKQKYTIGLPKLRIMSSFINEGALEWIWEQTRLRFEKTQLKQYIAQPTSLEQIVKLFIMYNFQSVYFNNLDIHNELLLYFWNDPEQRKTMLGY